MTSRRFVWAILVGSVASSILVPSNCSAKEPGWDLRVVTFGESREQIKSTPILERSYRPLHFYGNTVRRMHYRGTPLPVPKAIAPNSRKS